jgi:hypothetical protein
VLVTAAVVDVTTGVVLVCCSVLVVAAGVVVEAGSVLVDEATVEVVIGSVVVVAALLVVAADVVVSETSNASSLVTHPTTNDLRRVPSPSSVRLHLILVIGSFWFFGARAPLFQAVLHAAHDLRLTHVHASLRPTHISSTTLLHSTRRRVAALGLLQVSFSLASHLPAALTRLPTRKSHHKSTNNRPLCESPLVRRLRMPTNCATHQSTAQSARALLGVARVRPTLLCRVHALRPSVRPSVRPSSITRCSHDDTTFDNAPTPQPTLQDSTRLA